MKFKCIVEYEYPVEHKPPVKAELVVHGDWVVTRDITPLPKGHGRLIDVNDLLDDINLEDNEHNRDVNTGEIITLENIDRISTIIEADTESEVNNE